MNSCTNLVTIPMPLPMHGRHKPRGDTPVVQVPRPHLFVLLRSSLSGASGAGQGSDLSISEPESAHHQATKTTFHTDSPATTDSHTATTSGSTERKHKWDPHSRYWSDAHLFPDYGNPAQGGIMLQGIKNRLSNAVGIGSFKPIDRLNSKNGSDPIDLPNGTPKRRQESPVLSRPKRRRTEQHTSPSRSIAGDSDVVEISQTEPLQSAKEFRGTLSSQSNGDKKDDRDVVEYRQTEIYAGIKPKRPRQRHKRSHFTIEGSKRTPASESVNSRSRGNEINDDPIEDDVELIQKPPCKNENSSTSPIAEGGYTNSSFALEFADDADEIASQGHPFETSQMPSTGQRHHSHRQARLRGKHSANSSDDELQAVNDERPAKRRTVPSNGSSSLSSRGNIAKTQYSPRAQKDIFGGGLLVKRALAAPGWVYPPSAGTEEPTYRTICLLTADHSSPDSLKAVDPSGKEVAGLVWLELSLKRIKTIHYSPGSPVIKINKAISVTEHGTSGSLLMVEFGAAEDAGRCVNWVESQAPSSVDIVEITDHNILQSTFEKQFQEICSFAQRQSHRPAGGPMEPADDVKLLEHKQFTKKSAAAEPRRALRHRMQAPESAGLPQDAITSDLFYSSPSRLRPSTRSSARLPKEPSPKLELWTEQNPNWAAKWKIPLIFQRTTVDKEDIIRLDEGQFMNDSLISFYLKYLHHQLEQRDKRLADKIYIFNSFFYEKLKPKGKGINYDGVKSWTTKVDLFSFDYIIVPVNEASHWWVAIICNPGELLPSRKAEKSANRDAIAMDKDDTCNNEADRPRESNNSPSSVSPLVHDISHVTIDSSDDKEKVNNDEELIVDGAKKDGTDTAEEKTADSVAYPHTNKSTKGGKKRPPPPPRKYDPRDARILTLDSLGSAHSSVVRSLKEYLIAEAAEKKGETMENPGQLGTTVKDIPLQDNFTDCGVYLLGYIREFMKHPEKFVSDILQKEVRSWELNSSDLRNNLRTLILNLQKEYQAQEEEKRRVRAQQKRSKERSKEKSEPRSTNEVANNQVGSQVTTQHSSPAPVPAVASSASSRHGTPKMSEKVCKDVSRNTSPVSTKRTPEQKSNAQATKSPAESELGEGEHPPGKSTIPELRNSADVPRKSIEGPSGDDDEELRPTATPPHTRSRFTIIPVSPTEERFLKPLPKTPTPPPSSTMDAGTKERPTPSRRVAKRARGTTSPPSSVSQFGNGKVTRSRIVSNDEEPGKETIDLTT